MQPMALASSWLFGAPLGRPVIIREVEMGDAEVERRSQDLALSAHVIYACAK